MKTFEADSLETPSPVRTLQLHNVIILLKYVILRIKKLNVVWCPETAAMIQDGTLRTSVQIDD